MDRAFIEIINRGSNDRPISFVFFRCSITDLRQVLPPRERKQIAPPRLAGPRRLTLFLFFIHRGILVWNGNSVNQLSQPRQTAVSFAATSKQYSDECTFRSESNTAVTIYLHTHIYQYTPIICPAVLFPAHRLLCRPACRYYRYARPSLQLFRARIGAVIIARGVFRFDFSRFQPLLKCRP